MKKLQISIGVLFCLLCLFLVTGCSSTNNQVKSDNNVQKENQEKPSWYNKELIIDSSEFEFMSSKDVNIWPSYDDRSKVLGKVNQKDKVNIIGYDSNNDYCKIKKDKVEGWIACAWINNLPKDMTDSWETK